ncbi:arsenate reductase family protein [Halocynthiibacter namhaensis]|uniref:arsenate reductase family protein n=1 Tax=Halocynthiibacter namhaensis TaxID=1290553 RepID=UPI0005798F37|nr:ArsC/Spx/MgsR family protein [Halocynthiibacter namhaensis]
MKLYGIKACDTCRKALRELTKSGFVVEFVDIRATPQDAAFFDQVFATFGGISVNQRSKTWREMTETDRELPKSQMFTAFPTVMKRPVIEDDGVMTLGWSPETKAQWTGNS